MKTDSIEFQIVINALFWTFAIKGCYYWNMIYDFGIV